MTSSTSLRNSFADRVRHSIHARDSNLCVGLDPEKERIPEVVLREESPDGAVFRFLTEVVEITAEWAAAFKINKAFFDPLPEGIETLRNIVGFIHDNFSEIPVIIDCKVGDTPNTMRHYEQVLFGTLRADAILVNPYLGDDVWRSDGTYRGARGVLVRTSNPSAGMVQDLPLLDGRRVWEAVLDIVVAESTVELFPVLSLDSSSDANQVRSRVPENIPILAAGIGAQGKDPGVLRPLLSGGHSVLVSSSRAILYPNSCEGATWQDVVARAAKTTWSILQEQRA